MTKIVYQLRIICENNTTNERVDHIGWYGEVLDHCPNNDPNHTYIMTAIISTVQDNYIISRKITDSTGGNFRARGVDFNIAAGPEALSIEIGTIKFLTPVRIGTCIVTPPIECKNDNFSIYVHPDTPIGVILSEAAPGATTINVSDTVLQYLERGHFVELNDGAGHIEFLGECISENFVARTLLMDKAVITSFPAGSYVYLRSYLIDNCRIASDSPIVVGNNTAGSTSLVLPSQTVHIHYQNKTADTKFISFLVEMYY